MHTIPVFESNIVAHMFSFFVLYLIWALLMKIWWIITSIIMSWHCMTLIKMLSLFLLTPVVLPGLCFDQTNLPNRLICSFFSAGKKASLCWNSKVWRQTECCLWALFLEAKKVWIAVRIFQFLSCHECIHCLDSVTLFRENRYRRNEKKAISVILVITQSFLWNSNYTSQSRVVKHLWDLPWSVFTMRGVD